MKFTSEDLMKAMGLSIGDRVKVNDNIFEISYKCINLLDDEKETINTMPTYYLLNVDYEILPRPKRVGDTLCKQYCAGCPLIAIQCFGEETKNKPLYEVLDYALPSYHDQEIHDLLKARLDKEVLNNE